MNWLHVADIVRAAQCFEMQRYRRCNCRSGKCMKAYNPCVRHEGIAAICEALEVGDTSKGTPDDVAEWLVNHTCNNSRSGRSCQHKGCIAREGAIDFVKHASRKEAA